ncbi:MAG: PDZ domain-containing protein [Bacteroidales bacterium]|nr:PDZ domain-containing protein [Bacteroidales bacterium]
MKRIFITSVLIGIFIQISAQGTLLLREPAISKDHIVFVYANDLWSNTIGEKNAVRLTSSIGAERDPHFSPDGNWIAFTGQYDGNTDVYLVPVSGGEPERLTWHPSSDNVTGWMPGGNEIIFSSSRMGQPTKRSRLYSIDLKGGMPQPLPPHRAADGKISGDGKYLAYLPFGEWDSEWRNYRGGQAQPVWILNLEDFSLEQTPRTDNERNIKPAWFKNRIYFISERDYAANIWSFDPVSDDLKQHTFYGKFDVKDINAGPENIIFEQGGALHILNPETDEITDLSIEVRGDFHWARTRWEDVSPGNFTNPSLSPTGKRALLEYRGDIFTLPKEEGSWRNITNTPGTADRFPVWSPKGDKIAWFSDKSGAYTLMISSQDGLEETKEIKLPNPTYYFRPDWSPDGKYISYTDTDYNLWYVDVESGNATKVDTERYAHPNRTLNPSWSPDSKWIAYTKLGKNHFKEIKVYNIETGENHQLTNGMADALGPVWDESGKYMYFLASTNFGLKTGWLDMSNYDVDPTRNLYMIVLNSKDPSPLLPKSDEEEAEKEDSKNENGKKKKKEKKKQDESGDDELESKVSVVIDPENIERRIIALDVPARDYLFTLEGPENTVFYAENIPHQPGFTLHKYDLDERESMEFMAGINDASASFDRKSLLYKKNGTWGIVSAEGKSAKVGDGTLNTSNIKYRIVPGEEWKQIFTDGWRFQRDFLYVENVHGAPWNKIYDWYVPFVDHIKHRDDLNYLLDIVGGEVAVGHSFIRGGDYPDVPGVSVGLLGADYSIENGLYKIIKVYTTESWNPDLKAPLDIPGIDVKEGDYLISVNGNKISAGMNIYRLFEGTAGMQTVLEVSESPDASEPRTVVVEPVSNENGLRYYSWIEENRRKVDELSNGKLAYVYLPNTGGGGFTNFNRYYFSQQDKKGVIIDERNNGGGSAADYMIDVMNRELFGYFNSNAGDKRPFTSPISGIWGPKVMVINESAGSGGDYLPYAFSKMQIGPLVGTRTWGGLVGTWDTPPFIDGGRMVAPRGGFYDTEGNWAVENEGVAPDIEVIQDPATVIRGGDPQLEVAVETAMELLRDNEFELQQEPPAPIRWKRPDYFDLNNN